MMLWWCLRSKKPDVHRKYKPVLDYDYMAGQAEQMSNTAPEPMRAPLKNFAQVLREGRELATDRESEKEVYRKVSAAERAVAETSAYGVKYDDLTEEEKDMITEWAEIMINCEDVLIQGRDPIVMSEWNLNDQGGGRGR
jgi:hypothetical protein